MEWFDYNYSIWTRQVLLGKFMANLQERLRLLRKEKNLKQEDAARLLDISLSSYCRYEQGLRDPNAKVLWKIADFYEVTVDYLIGRTDER